jgi:hypothetical protein
MRRAERGVGTLALVLAGLAGVAAQAGEASPLRTAASFQLDVTASSCCVVDLFVSWPPGFTPGRVRPFDVAFEGVHHPDFALQGQVVVDETLGPYLRVTLSPAATPAAGTYAVSLRVEDASKAPGPAVTVQFSLERPAARLVADSRLKFVQVLDGLPEVFSFSNPAALQVAEVGRASGVTGLQLVPSQGARWDATLTPVSVGPGGAAAAPLRLLGGGLEPGVYPTAWELRAPELASPVKVEGELRVRRSTSWILLLSLLGALVGFLARGALKRLVDSSAARYALARGAEDLEAELAAHADGVLHDALTETRRGLEDQGAGLLGADEARGRLERAQEALRAALVDLAARRSSLQAQVQKLSWIATAPWSLAGEVATPAAALGAAASGARRDLALDDVSGGAERLRLQLVAALAALASAGRTWQRRALEDLAPPWWPVLDGEPDLAPAFEDASRSLGRALPAELPLALDDLLAALLAALQLLHEQRSGLASLASAVLAQARATVSRVAALLDGEAEVEALAVALEAVDPQAPEAALARTREALAAVAANLRARSDSAVVAGALEGRRFVDAAERLATAAARRLTARTTGAGPEVEALAEVRLLPAPVLDGRPSRLVEPLLAAPGVGPALRPLTRRRAEAWRAWLLSRLMQFAVTTALIAVVGFFLFLDGFVGTPAELAKVFFWGFSLDLGLDGIVSQARALGGAR